jgi:hypothetical protein
MGGYSSFITPKSKVLIARIEKGCAELWATVKPIITYQVSPPCGGELVDECKMGISRRNSIPAG